MSETTTQTTPDPAATAPAMDAKEIEAGKTFAILSYIISILCLVPLIQKDNAFSLYHAKQVLLLLITSVALMVVNVIPCLGQIVSMVGFLGVLVLVIIGLINAIKGEAKPLPLIGKLAETWFKDIQKKA
ncbi:MAG: hypothetical protein PHR35_04915 [Kiritimatiellae bacterium]|nr:hypothetical protein [Kiritimatiellia bacterium]